MMLVLADANDCILDCSRPSITLSTSSIMLLSSLCGKSSASTGSLTVSSAAGRAYNMEIVL